jgi:hypothetical protein
MADDEDDVDALLASVDALLIKTEPIKMEKKHDYETDYLVQKKKKLHYHLKEPPFNDECISGACYQLQELLSRPPATPDCVAKSEIGVLLRGIATEEKNARVQTLTRELLNHWDLTE